MTTFSEFLRKLEEETEGSEAPVKRGRGRPKGSKSFGASKARNMTNDEAGADAEKPSFTDHLLKATDTHEGGDVTFDNGKTHHVSRFHARNALFHLGKPQKPEEKDKVRKYIGANVDNMHSMRLSGGKIPEPEAAYDPDARIKARTAQINTGAKTPKPAVDYAKADRASMAQKILAKRKANQ
jgi:hypothetical protein